MTGTLLLTQVAMRRDRSHLLLWMMGVLIGALICSVNITTGYGDESLRVESLEIVSSNPALLIGRGLPMGTSEGAYLFHQYGVFLATIFALFATFFAVRHGRAEEEDGTRELLRATATGHVANLAATFIAGTIATAGLAAAMVTGLTLGGADLLGSIRAGIVCTLVGAVFLAVGALCGLIAPSTRVATGLGAGVSVVLYGVRVVADINAEIDPQTFVSTPSMLGWFSPFSLAVIADPYGVIDLSALLVLAGAAAVVGAAAIMVERRRELGDSIVPPRPGPAHSPPSLRTPLRLSLRLQRGTLVAMIALGAVVGAFAAMLAVLALAGANDEAVAETIRSILAIEGPLYEILLSYVMVLVGETAAIAGALVVLRARTEEAAGNVELVRSTAFGAGRWLIGVLAVGVLSILLVLGASWVGAAAVYLAQGQPATAVWQVLGATVAQLPATLLYLGIIALIFAAVPRLTQAVAWTILVAGVVLAELGGRLGLPDWVIALSPFVHTPLVTMANPDWSGAIWMPAVALLAAVSAAIVYRRRDLSP